MIDKGTSDAFFALLGRSLWPGENSFAGKLTDDGWEKIRTLSERHSVQGIVFDAVRTLPQDCGMTSLMKAKWLAETVAMEHRYSAMASLIARQGQLWEKNGITAVLLKGHSVAKYYPVPEHRSCGDIDWWFPSSSGWTKANRIVRERGESLSSDSDGDVHYFVGDIVVEHHRKGLSAEGAEGLLLYLDSHILRHAMVFGVGMKQICDLAAAYTGLYGNYDGEKLKMLVGDSGMLKWTNLLHGMLVKVLGMPEKYLPFPEGEAVKKADMDFLVDMILRDGHFGHLRRKKLLPVLQRFVFFVRYCPGILFNLYGKLIVGHLSRRKYA